jgi:hypothetical protein
MLDGAWFAHHYKWNLANKLKFWCFNTKWNETNYSFELEDKGLDLGKGRRERYDMMEIRCVKDE